MPPWGAFGILIWWGHVDHSRITLGLLVGAALAPVMRFK
jgi:hypothetical protein